MKFKTFVVLSVLAALGYGGMAGSGLFDNMGSKIKKIKKEISLERSVLNEPFKCGTYFYSKNETELGIDSRCIIHDLSQIKKNRATNLESMTEPSEQRKVSYTYTGLETDIKRIVVETAIKQDVDDDFIFSMIKHESNFNPNAVGYDREIGLMQIKLNIAKDYDPNITVEKLFIPSVNVGIATAHFKYLLDKYGGYYNLALIAYNSGETNLDNSINMVKEARSGKTKYDVIGYTREPNGEFKRVITRTVDISGLRNAKDDWTGYKVALKLVSKDADKTIEYAQDIMRDAIDYQNI